MKQYYTQEVDAEGNIITENGEVVSRALSDLIRFDRTPPPPDHDDAAWECRRKDREILVKKVERENPSNRG